MAEPEALQWSVENCTIARTLSIIGDRWSFIVLREVFTGIRRFDDLTVRTAVPRQVLTERLRRLVDAGVLKRVPYQEPGRRVREEYRLTQQGLDLYPVFLALQAWGDSYLADPEGPPIAFVHRDCGEPVSLTVTCAEGHAVHGARDVVSTAGPGARRRAPRREPEQTPDMTIDLWWPLLPTETRQWLMSNNGDAVPPSLMAEIAAAGGPAVADPWWTEHEGSTGRSMPDEATDWIEETANAEGSAV